MQRRRKGFENGTRRRFYPPARDVVLSGRRRRACLKGLRYAIVSVWLCLWLTAIFLPAGWAQFGFIPFGWGQMSLAPAPARVVALVVDPRSDSVIYLAAPGGGVWKTGDRGKTWHPLFDFLYSVQVCSVVLDPNSPDVLYAGTGDDQSPRPAQGVARSTDGGLTWNIGVRFTNQPVCALAVDPANSARILAGSAEGLFLSTDSGTSWRKVLSTAITSVAFDGKGSVYAGELGPDDPAPRSNVLVRSSDGGLTWTTLSLPVSPNTTNAQTNWVSIMARGNTLYLVISYQFFLPSNVGLDFYRSTDGGNTWTVVPSIGATAPPVQVFADANAQNLYVAGKYMLASTDQGNTWNIIPSDTLQFHTGIFTGGSLLIAGEGGLELLPLSAGAPSSVLGLSMGRFLSITLASSGDPWAGGPAGLFDLHQPGFYGVPVGSVAAATTASSHNVFAAGNTSVYQSTDGGVTFSSSIVIPPGEWRAPFPPLVMSPTNPATAFVAGQRLYRTLNSGATWTSFSTIDPITSNVVIALAIAPAGGGRTMYAANACLPEVALRSCSNASTIWRSTNSGLTWTRMSTVLGLVNALAGDPRQANTVYAAVGAFPGGPSTTAGYIAGDLVSSSDGGATWTSIRGNLPPVPINSIVIDPTSLPTVTFTPPVPGRPFVPPQLQPAQTLYVGTDAGVFVSFNAGSQWTAISSGLPPTPITQLSLQQPAATLEAATFGRGIFQASVANLSASLIANPLSANLTLNQGASKTVILSLANVSSAALKWQLTPLDSWLSLPQSSGSLQPGGSSVATLVVSSAGLLVGTYLGRLQLTAGAQAQNILVTLQVTTPPATMTIASGNNATGQVGAAMPPLVVSALDATGAPVPGVSVNFAITSGGGSLSSRTSLSDAGGRASTVLTLPSTPGTVQVVATAGNLSVTFNLTAVLNVSPTLMANSVVNGVTFNSATPPSPGSIVAIFGQSLAGSSAAAETFPLPTSLQGTSVLLDSPAGEVALPLFFVSPLQVNALVPFEVAPGVYTLRLVANSVFSNPVQISIAPFSPGIFTMNPNGQGQGIFVKADGSLVSAANPADRGSVVSLFATGLGAVDPPVISGNPGASEEPLNLTVQMPRVFFDNYEAEVLYAGLAPGFAGLYQVNVRVPIQVSPATNISVSLTIGPAATASNRVAVPVE